MKEKYEKYGEKDESLLTLLYGENTSEFSQLLFGLE